jgi:hypothetical protein
MFHNSIIQDVPIVVEPCVQVIEATCAVADGANGLRCFPVQLYRLELDNRLIDKLPFVPSTKTPHVFCPVTTLKDAPFLLVYDYMGRLHTWYKRQKKSAWSRYEFCSEVSGRPEVTPSVRFRFLNEKQQRRFLTLTEQLMRQSRGGVINCDDVQEFVRFIGRLRTPPVVVDVATTAETAKNA